MESETKCLSEIEASYEVEYALRQEIHSKIGEILKLEHINAKHCREIERLNARIFTILETTPDISDGSQDTISDDKIDHVSECVNLFEYIKDLIVKLSEKDGIASINPGIIDPKYIESAVRYTMPGLFSIYALLGDEDLKRIEFAGVILDKFGINTMSKYEELVKRGDIGIVTLDNRSDFKETHHSGDTGYNTVRKFR